MLKRLRQSVSSKTIIRRLPFAKWKWGPQIDSENKWGGGEAVGVRLGTVLMLIISTTGLQEPSMLCLPTLPYRLFTSTHQHSPSAALKNTLTHTLKETRAQREHTHTQVYFSVESDSVGVNTSGTGRRESSINAWRKMPINENKLYVYQRVKAHKVNAVTYDKAHFSSFHNKENVQMILKLVPPLLPPTADKNLSLCCCEKSKQTKK